MPAGGVPPDEGSSFSEVELFAPLSEQEIRELGSRVPRMSLEKGQIFYTPWHRGESFFLLVEGRIRIFRVREAREITLSVKHPGEFFGEAALAGMPKGAWAQALEPVTLAIMGRKVLHRLLADKPRMGAMMVELLVERLGVYEDKLEELSLMDTPARLASLLVRMIEGEGVPDDGGYMMIPDHYTHALLASMIGCERPALTRALRDLGQADLIRVSERQIHVTDLEALTRYVGEG